MRRVDPRNPQRVFVSIHGRLFLTPAGITTPLTFGLFTPIALMRISTSGATSMTTTSAVLLLTASLTATSAYPQSCFKGSTFLLRILLLESVPCIIPLPLGNLALHHVLECGLMNLGMTLVGHRFIFVWSGLVWPGPGGPVPGPGGPVPVARPRCPVPVAQRRAAPPFFAVPGGPAPVPVPVCRLSCPGLVLVARWPGPGPGSGLL